MKDSGLLTGVYRYPVKGLSGEPLDRIALSVGETIAGDRCYAIENGEGSFDVASPRHLPKVNFIMLMRHEGLAALEGKFDFSSKTLTISSWGQRIVCGNLETPKGRQAIEDFLAGYLVGRLRGRPRVVSAPGHSFSDVAAKCLHVVNLASIRALEEHCEMEIDPLRFRPNLIIDTGRAWQEFDLVGSDLAIGEARLKVIKRTERCQAINVDPVTAERDSDLVMHLKALLGHTDFGVYARVEKPGSIAVGNRVAIT